MAMMEALLKIRAAVSGEGDVNKLGAALGGLNKTATTVTGGLKGMLGSVGGLSGALGALVPLLSGAGLLAMAKGAIDAADNMRDMSIRTGVSVEMLSKLKTAAEMSGTSIEDVGKALTKTAIAIGNSSGATANAVAAGIGQLRVSIADQMRLLEQRDQQQIANIRSTADRQVQAVKDGEQRQVDAIERAKDQRMAVLQNESDQRMREISRRYRQEEKLLNDSFDDRRDAERQQADDQLTQLERQIDRRFEARRKAIQEDKSLSDAAKEQAVQSLRDQQDAELKELRNGFEQRAKVRDRYYRDQQDAAQQAIEARKQKEVDAEKAVTDAQKRAIEDRAKAEKAAAAKVSADRQAAIRASADAQVKAIQDGNKRAQDAYAKLGISLRNADGSQRKVGEVFMDVFDALRKLPTASDRAAAAFDLYGGKLATKLLPLFAMTRGEVEKLSASITTDFADAADSFNDKLPQINGSLMKLAAGIGTTLLPVLNLLADVAMGIASALASLPEPLRNIVVIGAAIAVAWGPLTGILTAVVGWLAAIGPTIAGTLGIVGPAIAAIGGFFTTLTAVAAVAATGIIMALETVLVWISTTLIPGLLAFFSGPVGWTVLAVAAVVAMAIAFREPIWNFLVWMSQNWRKGLDAVLGFGYAIYIKPWVDLFNGVRVVVQAAVRWISTTWANLGPIMANALRNLAAAASAPFVAILNNVRAIFRSILQAVANGINTAGSMVNNLISRFNSLPGPFKISLVPTFNVPAFATGGVVGRKTLAYVGDGGEPEYIIPQSKMTLASQRFLAGARGSSVLTSGGTTNRTTSGRAPVISITTGPVMHFEGKNYVTMQDMERAMRATADGMLGRLRTPAARIALGMR